VAILLYLFHIVLQIEANGYYSIYYLGHYEMKIF